MLRFIFSGIPLEHPGPAIFIDRDGVINKRIADGYVLEWSQFEFIPGIPQALKALAALKVPLIVVSNQAAVGKGILTPSQLELITNRMQNALLKDGVLISAAYYCPHRIDECCECRKPGSKLLYLAAKDFNLDLKRCIFIGDSKSDVDAARFAKCQPVLFDPAKLHASCLWAEGVPRASNPAHLPETVERALTQDATGCSTVSQ